MEKWNELCYNLSENVSSNLSEDLFELKVIQALDVLGWKGFKGDLNIRSPLKVGAAKRLTPDIVVKSENKDLFVIEVKKPGIPLNSEFESQLKSYMRQLKLDFGLLIGQKIQIFYDGPLNDSKFILIDEIDFKRDSENGLKFIELFNKENYNVDSLKEFTIKSLEKINRKENFNLLTKKIISEGFKENVFSLIKQELIREYDGELIDSVLKDLKIEISDKNLSNINNSTFIKSIKKLPSNKPINNNSPKSKMKTKELFECGLIKKGDQLKIKDCDNSTAIVIDGKNVSYNDEEMSYNAWGVKVKGQNTNIYLAALNEKDEFLEELRN